MISMLEKVSVFRSTGLITLVLLMWRWMGLFLSKNVLSCWEFLCLLNWVGFITLSPLLKLSPRKLGLSSVLWSLFLPKLLFISINLPYSLPRSPVVTCGLVLINCDLDMLDKLQKRIYRTVGPTLAACREPLGHRWDIASLSHFFRYFFGRYSPELTELVLFPFFFLEIPLVILTDCVIFLSSFPDVNEDVCVNVVFPHAAWLLNSLPAECVPCTYDLNSFKSRVNRHLLFLGYF